MVWGPRSGRSSGRLLDPSCLVPPHFRSHLKWLDTQGFECLQVSVEMRRHPRQEIWGVSVFHSTGLPPRAFPPDSTLKSSGCEATGTSAPPAMRTDHVYAMVLPPGGHASEQNACSRYALCWLNFSPPAQFSLHLQLSGADSGSGLSGPRPDVLEYYSEYSRERDDGWLPLLDVERDERDRLARHAQRVAHVRVGGEHLDLVGAQRHQMARR